MLPRASSTEPPKKGTVWRRVVLLCLPVLYVAVGVFSSGERRPIAVLDVFVALGVAVVCALRTPKEGSTFVRRAYLCTSASVAVAIATCELTTRHAWASLLREGLSLGASYYAVRAIFQIPSDGGLAEAATVAAHARRPTLVDAERFALLATALAWAQAILVDATALFDRGSSLQDTAAVAGAVGGYGACLVIGATALVVSGMRHLELGVPPRALSCAAAVGVGLLVAVELSLVSGMRADDAIALGLGVATMGVTRLARTTDGLLVAARGRRALTLLLFGGPVVVLAAISANGRSSGQIVFFFAGVAMLVGAVAAKLEEPFLPVKGALLRALAEAQTKVRDRDTREAMAHALVRLREAGGQVPTADVRSASAELWMLHPSRVFTVDAAGYLQERSAELPTSVFDVAKDEPYLTVRVDVLRALEIRRPDLRPLLRWLEQRDALSATMVSGGDEPDGLLVVPRGLRGEAMTLEEVRETKRLADIFVAICQSESARERHLARERDLSERIERLDDRVAELTHAISLDAARNELASSRLARPASAGIYSAASRFAFDAIARRIERDAPLVVLARVGIDPVPFIARAHLAGPRKDLPLVIVDGTSSREHDLDRWKSARSSPLALSQGGRLVLVDGAALPHDVQRLVARALVERRPPWEHPARLDVTLAFTSTTDLEPLVADDRLTHDLFRLLEDARPVSLPGLSERAEDLFSIVADRLAREGLRVRGRPVGIDAAAFARLVEHPFEGEDAELATIVARLVANVSGDVVRATDMDALGIGHVASRRYQV